MSCRRSLGEARSRSMPDWSLGGREQVVCDDNREHERPQAVRSRRPYSVSNPSANAVSVDIAMPQPSAAELPTRDRRRGAHAAERRRRRCEQDRRAAAVGAQELALRAREPARPRGCRRPEVRAGGHHPSATLDGAACDQRARRPVGAGRLSRTRGPLPWSSRASAGFGRSHDRRGAAGTCRSGAGPPVPA
jgi:hypothetical protein